VCDVCEGKKIILPFVVKQSEWISVKDRPLFTLNRHGWEVTKDGEGEFFAAVPMQDGTWWMRHCIIQDEIGLCVVGDEDNESAGFGMEEVTHYQFIPSPPKP
jgi:hypothetical protein